MKYDFHFNPRFFFPGQCENNPIGLDEYVLFPVYSSTEQSTYEAFEVYFGRNGWCAQDGDSQMTLTISFERLIKVCAVEIASVEHHDALGSYANLVTVELSADVDGNTFSSPQVTLFKSYKSP